MEFTVQVGEPDVTHRTSWRESIGMSWEYSAEVILQSIMHAKAVLLAIAAAITVLTAVFKACAVHERCMCCA